MIRWLRRWGETGSFAPDQMGGHRPHLTCGAQENWLLSRNKTGDFRLRELTFELAERGLRVSGKSGTVQC